MQTTTETIFYKVHCCIDGSTLTFTQEEYEQLEPAALGLYAVGDRFLEHRLCPNCGSTICVEHAAHVTEETYSK